MIRTGSVDWFAFELPSTLPMHWAQALSESERERAERFATPILRARYVHGRLTMRRTLAARMGLATADALEIVEGEHGKPALIDDGAPAFNLSHCEDRAVLALRAREPVGVDIERLRALPDCEALAERVLCDGERQTIAGADAAERSHALLCAWTRKEACMKALGLGIGIVEPASVVTGVVPTAARVLVRWNDTTHSLDVTTVRVDDFWVSIAEGSC
jgi:4'-phosphopantetheinyl transferase